MNLASTLKHAAETAASAARSHAPEREGERAEESAAPERIAVIADSCTDVPVDFAAEHGVHVIPLHINYEHESYLDRVDIQPEEVYARMPGEIPTTSTPTPAEVSAAFDAVAAEGFTHVVAVTISSGLSATCDLVRSIAAGRADLTTEVVDTKNIGFGAGFSVILAAQLVEAGLSFSEVCARVEAAAKRAQVFFCVDTLDYLRAGGRIGAAAYAIGSRLDVRPIITCNEEGVYVPVAKAHGRKASLKKTLQLVEKRALELREQGAQELRLAVVHAAAEDEARGLEAKLREMFPGVDILFGQLSPALVVHTGPKMIGLGVQAVA